MTARIEVRATPCVWIEVHGEKREPAPYDPTKDPKGFGPLPLTRSDEGLVSRILKWSTESGVYSLRGMTSGGGIYTALYLPDDAEKLLAWLKEQGIEANAASNYNGENP